jgi:hypothetical protein
MTAGTTSPTGSCVSLAASRLLAGFATLMVLAAPLSAQQSAPKADDAHRKEDIAKHRAIAAAHESAARCLEQGQKESACHEALRKACQGIAVGRYCGMKHGH